MATESGRTDTNLELEGVEKDLRENPGSFSFFQAVRILQRLAPERARVGRFAPLGREAVRLGTNPSLAFPRGEIHDITDESEKGDGPPRMSVNFMGLVGNRGVLPTHYSIEVLKERDRDEKPLTDFLDIFQNRLLALFYRAWERARFFIPHERGETDWATTHLFDLMGLRLEAVRHQIPDEARSFLFFSGLLSARHRNALGLEQLLADFFEVPVTVEQFVGGWYRVADDSQCRLDESSGMGLGLGGGTVVGDEIWDPQAKVRIRIGPLPREIYDNFLQGQAGYRAVATIARFYADDHFDFELQPVLRKEDVPGVVLGGSEPAPLSWCTWLSTRAFEEDADQTILALSVQEEAE